MHKQIMNLIMWVQLRVSQELLEHHGNNIPRGFECWTLNWASLIFPTHTMGVQLRIIWNVITMIYREGRGI